MQSLGVEDRLHVLIVDGPLMRPAIGLVGEDILRAMKTTLDPAWIMNPGALVTREDG